MVLQITEKFILRTRFYTEAPGSGLRASLAGLGSARWVPTGCPYGEFTLADAWAETGKHLTISSIQFNSIRWEGLWPWAGSWGGRYQLPGGAIRAKRCDARSVTAKRRRRRRRREKRKREKHCVIAARRSIRSSLFSPGSPSRDAAATGREFELPRAREKADADPRTTEIRGGGVHSSWTRGPVSWTAIGQSLTMRSGRRGRWQVVEARGRRLRQ